jgi:hypothetical protein
MGSEVFCSLRLPMVRKSKRKQTIIAFEKHVTAIPINLQRYQLLISRYSQFGGGDQELKEVKDAGTLIFEFLELLSDCDTQKKQIKILQDKKNSLKVHLLSSPLFSPSLRKCYRNLIARVSTMPTHW